MIRRFFPLPAMASTPGLEIPINLPCAFLVTASPLQHSNVTSEFSFLGHGRTRRLEGQHDGQRYEKRAAVLFAGEVKLDISLLGTHGETIEGLLFDSDFDNYRKPKLGANML